MMSNVSYWATCDQQMAMVQHKVQELFLQLKEDQEWERYCQKNSILCDNTRQDDAKEDHQVYKETGVQVQLPQVPRRALSNKPASASHSCSNMTKEIPVPKPSVRIQKGIQKPRDMYSADLKFIKEKLSDLQLDLDDLRRRKNSSLNLARSVEFNHQEYNPLNREEFLRNSLKNTLSQMDAARVVEGSDTEVVSSQATSGRQRSITFQVPYVLKAERMLERRRMQSLSNPSAVVRSKKTLKKKPSILFSRPNSRSLIGKCSAQNPSPSQPLEKEESVDQLVDEIVEDLITEAVPAVERAQQLKEQHVKDSITSLTEKINRIEEEERMVREKWKSLKTRNASSAPFSRPNSEIESAEQEPTINRSENASAKRNTEAIDSARPFDVSSRKEVGKRVAGNATFSVDMPPKATALHLDSRVVRNIAQYRRSFAQYLRRTFHVEADSLVPWISFNQAADSILNDCLRDVEAELQCIPQSIVLDMYNSEFVSLV